MTDHQSVSLDDVKNVSLSSVAVPMSVPVSVSVCPCLFVALSVSSVCYTHKVLMCVPECAHCVMAQTNWYPYACAVQCAYWC